jgi:hypothetical protein
MARGKKEGRRGGKGDRGGARVDPPQEGNLRYKRQAIFLSSGIFTKTKCPVV